MDKIRLGHILLVAATALTAAASVAGGVLLFGHNSPDTGGRAMELGLGTALLTAGVAVFAGMWRFRKARRSGAALVAVGALPVAICFWWTGIVPAVAVPVAVASVIRGRRLAREQQAAVPRAPTTG